MDESDKNKMGILGLFAYVFGLGAIATAPLMVKRIEYAGKPNTFQVTKDYNNDGATDGVLKKQGGHLVPMYCVTDANGSRYVSADEFKTLYPDSIIDFTKLEQMVNDGNFDLEKKK